MKIISTKELEKLQAQAEKGKDASKIEKRLKKQMEIMREEHNEAQEDLRDTKNREIRVVKRELKKAQDGTKDAIEDALAEHENDVEDLKRNHERELSRIQDTVKDLEERNEVLEEKVETEANLLRKELDIQSRESEVERAADLVKKREEAVDKRIKEFDSRKDGELEAAEKRGYTNGVADTLREKNDQADKATDKVLSLAEKALDRETTVVTPVVAPMMPQQKQGK